MTMLRQSKGFTFICLACTLLTLSSCLTSKKLDKFVAEQYNNELPKPSKKKKAEIEVMSSNPIDNSQISTTVHKTDKFLPLLVYWKYDHRQICSLNPSISKTNFSNAINSLATKGLIEKLNGGKLELTVEQAPSAFSVVVKENLIWVIYAFSWAKVYIEPDMNDLIVSYRLMDSKAGIKTGKISVKNTDKNKGLRFFQSWKSATSEYLSEYNANYTSMTKTFVSQLTNEL
jgi:hypothetical protein